MDPTLFNLRAATCTVGVAATLSAVAVGCDPHRSHERRTWTSGDQVQAPFPNQSDPASAV